MTWSRLACPILVAVVLSAPVSAAGQERTVDPSSVDGARVLKDAQQELRVLAEATGGFATLDMQAPPSTAAPAPLRSSAAVQSFSIVLLEGDSQSTSMPADVPAGVRNALADMKDFLPFKGYRLYDTALVSAPLVTRAATVQLKGAEGLQQSFEVGLTVNGTSPRLSLTVYVREGGDVALNTSLTMDVGETVIVGTSRIRGDKGLIALLTAVPARR